MCLYCGVLATSTILLTCNFMSLVSGGPQWGGAVVFPGRVSLEGAPVLPGAGAAGGDAHQVHPLSGPEWTVEGSVRPRRAQHFPEQVPTSSKRDLPFVFIKGNLNVCKGAACDVERQEHPKQVCLSIKQHLKDDVT